MSAPTRIAAAGLVTLAALASAGEAGAAPFPEPGTFERAGENLLAGGDFEGKSLQERWKWNDNRGSFTVRAARGRSGDRAAALVSTGTSGRGKFFTAGGFPVPAGADIRVSLWAKAEDHVGGTWVNYEGEAGEGHAKFDIAGGTYDWTRYVHRTTVPAGKRPPGEPVRLEIWFYVYGRGRLLLDDIDCRVITRDAEAEDETRRLADAAARRAARAVTRSRSWGVAVTDATRRVFRDRPFTGPHAPAVELDIARREFEGCQLLVFAGDEDLLDVKVSAGALRGPGVIDASDVQVLPVAYCDRSKAPPVPWYEGQSSRWWPDPLVPNRSFTVTKGTIQPVYLRFHCPPGTEPGRYSGSVRVKSSAGEAVVPVRLTVRKPEMPVRLHIKSMCVSGKKDRPYLDLALEQRMAIGNIAKGMGWTKPNFPARGGSFDFSEVEKTLEYSIGRGMNAFIMASTPKTGKWGFPKTYSPEWKRNMTKVVREYGAWLKRKGWFEMAYYNNIDEPSKGRWEQCKEIYRMVKAADRDVRVFHCVNTVGALDYLKGHADAWDVYVQQADQQQAEARRREGSEIWWAICVWPREHPNLFVEYPLADARVVGWSAFKYQVAGFEYWQMTSWEKGNPKDGSWAACPDGVLTTTWRYSKRQSGDGYLCYPGDGGVPVNSLRFEALRDGLEDNELLWQLRERLPSLTRASRAEAERILGFEGAGRGEGGEALVTNMFIYSTDPARLIAERRRVLELLEGAGGR